MKIDGLPVVDAGRPTILTITAGDIRAGKPGDPTCCAAALACMRQLGASAALVHMARIYVKFGKKWVRYHTPGSIRSEVIAFDRRSSFKPGDYKLNPLQPSKTTGRQQGTRNGQTRHGQSKKRRAAPHFLTNVRERMAHFQHDKQK